MDKRFIFSRFADNERFRSIGGCDTHFRIGIWEILDNEPCQILREANRFTRPKKLDWNLDADGLQVSILIKPFTDDVDETREIGIDILLKMFEHHINIPVILRFG